VTTIYPTRARARAHPLSLSLSLSLSVSLFVSCHRFLRSCRYYYYIPRQEGPRTERTFLPRVSDTNCSPPLASPLLSPLSSPSVRRFVAPKLIGEKRTRGPNDSASEKEHRAQLRGVMSFISRSSRNRAEEPTRQFSAGIFLARASATAFGLLNMKRQITSHPRKR